MNESVGFGQSKACMLWRVASVICLISFLHFVLFEYVRLRALVMSKAIMILNKNIEASVILAMAKTRKSK